ncbi:MAG: sulfatase [Opitutaceae bacterium]
MKTASSPPPNVLLVLFDDLNTNTGFFGDRAARTPNLDRFAERATLFANAHCAIAVCNPSRAALLTGQPPWATGVWRQQQDWLRECSPEAMTLPMFFKAAGYHAVGAGKLFDSAKPDPSSWSRYLFWDPAAPANRGIERYYDAPTPQPRSRPATTYAERYGRNIDFGPVDAAADAMPDHLVVSKAADFLQERSGQPFFLGVGLHKPHLPWYLPQSYFDAFPLAEVEMPLAPPDDLDDVPPAGRKLVEERGGSSFTRFPEVVANGDAKRWVQGYRAAVMFADEEFGRLMEALDASPHADNTIVVVTSDHGFHLGQKQHLHKLTLWDEATRIPLLVRLPRQHSARRRDEAVSLLDVFPTLVDLAGQRNDGRASLAGRSLRPLLTDAADDFDWPDGVVSSVSPGNHSLRTKHWRYTRYADGGEELYHFTTDPHELHNLAADESYATQRRGLRMELERQLTWQPPASSGDRHPSKTCGLSE